MSPSLLFANKKIIISTQVKIIGTFLRNLFPIEAGSFVSASMIFNFITIFPMLPDFGKSRKIKYKYANEVENIARKIILSGGFCRISGIIIKNKNRTLFINAEIKKSMKKAAILLGYIFAPFAARFAENSILLITNFPLKSQRTGSELYPLRIILPVRRPQSFGIKICSYILTL